MGKIDSQENIVRLMNQYQNLIFSICLKSTGDYHSAEDLTQETFVSAYLHWDTFDGKAEKAWICRIASNKCIDYQRSLARKNTVPILEEMEETIFVSKEEPLDEIIDSEILEIFAKECRGLKEPYCVVAHQYFIQGKTAREIAEASGVPIKTVQTQIHRSKKMLKEKIPKEMLIG